MSPSPKTMSKKKAKKKAKKKVTKKAPAKLSKEVREALKLTIDRPTDTKGRSLEELQMIVLQCWHIKEHRVRPSVQMIWGRIKKERIGPYFFNGTYHEALIVLANVPQAGIISLQSVVDPADLEKFEAHLEAMADE